MPNLLDVGNVLKTLREVDLNAIREEAERHFTIAVVGREGAGKTTLIGQMRTGERVEVFSAAPVVSEHDLAHVRPNDLLGSSLVIVVLDATRLDLERERQIFDPVQQAGVPVLVAYNHGDRVADTGPVTATMGYWNKAEVIVMAATDRASVKRNFVPAVLRRWPAERQISLARFLPLFRGAVVKKLIEDTSMANVTFSVTTGLAEIVPVLNVPLTMGDMIVLTKNQVLMAYKIALAEGLEADWQHTIPEIVGVIGSGFLWRQVARGLAGLLPVWGIIPKTAVAYSGTLATGRAVQFWAETGEKMTPEALQAITREALERGRTIASNILAKRPGSLAQLRERLPRLPGRKAQAKTACPNCGQIVPEDSRFCPRCGESFVPKALPKPAQENPT